MWIAVVLALRRRCSGLLLGFWWQWLVRGLLVRLLAVARVVAGADAVLEVVLSLWLTLVAERAG